MTSEAAPSIVSGDTYQVLPAMPPEQYEEERASDQCDWLIRQGFTPDSWLGDEGQRYRRRYGMRDDECMKGAWETWRTANVGA